MRVIKVVEEGEQLNKKECNMALQAWSLLSPNITQNTLRPYIILVSEATRHLILTELTEDKMDEMQKERARCQELVEECHRNG